MYMLHKCKDKLRAKGDHSGSGSIHDTRLISLCAPSISDNLHFAASSFHPLPLRKNLFLSQNVIRKAYYGIIVDNPIYDSGERSAGVANTHIDPSPLLFTAALSKE